MLYSCDAFDIPKSARDINMAAIAKRQTGGGKNETFILRV
jgi:hypothetical protein